MKNFFNILLVLCIFCNIPALAETQQTIVNEQSYAQVHIQNTHTDGNKQRIKNTRSWFCVNIIVNGKIKDNADNNVK